MISKFAALIALLQMKSKILRTLYDLNPHTISPNFQSRDYKKYFGMRVLHRIRHDSFRKRSS